MQIETSHQDLQDFRKATGFISPPERVLGEVKNGPKRDMLSIYVCSLYMYIRIYACYMNISEKTI